MNDVSGVSGTGIIALGCEFPNGLVALSWKSEYQSITFFQSISVLETIHSHNGKDQTKIVWVDEKFEDLEVKAKELKEKEKEEQELEELIEMEKEEEEKKKEEQNNA